MACVTLLSSGCTKEARKLHYLSQAKADFTAGKHEAAEIEYLKVLRVAPGNPTAISHLGLIYEAQGRYPQALAFLKKALELTPDNIDLRLKLCLTEAAIRQFKDAHQDAERVLQKEPGQADALLVLAQSVLSLKDVQDTTQEIELLRKNDKDRAVYHLALGNLYLLQGQITNFAAEVDKALQLEPKLPATQLALGTLCWLSNDVTHADVAFKTAASLASPRSSIPLKYADFKLKTGSVDDAKKILEDVTRQAPDFFPAWNALAQVAFSQGKLDDCSKILEKVLATDRINYEATLLDSAVKLSQNKAPQAIAELERLQKYYAQSPAIPLRLAQAYSLNGENGKAENATKDALKLDPNFPEAIIAMADINIKKGDPVSAELSLERLVRRRPELAQAHLLLAAAYTSQGNFDQALAVYRRMQPLFAKSPQIPLLMATILARQHHTAEARAACEQSLKLAPDYLPPLEELVNLDLMEKHPQTALDRLNEQIKRRPSVPELHLLLAKVYIDQKDYTNAEAILQKTIQMAPDLRTSYLMLAQLYMASNQAQRALDKLNAFVARTNDVPALMQIGMIDEGMTNYPAARVAYEKLLTIDPKFAVALNNLAYLYCEHFNELDKAVQLAQQAHQMYPADPSVADTLGWILYRKGDYPGAFSLLTQAAAGLPDDPEVQCHLGMVRYALGQDGPARLALQHALQGDREYLGKNEARSRLAILTIDPNTADAATRSLLEKRVADAPNDPIALIRLAAIYDHQGDATRAAKNYQQALALNPQNAVVLTRLARIYAAPGPLNDFQKALGYAKDAHAAAPDDDSISQLLGHLVCQAGDYKWASSLLQDAVFKSPNDPGLQYDLARAYYGLGQLDSAQTALQSAITLLTPPTGVTSPSPGREGSLDISDLRRFLSFLTTYRTVRDGSASTPLSSAVTLPAASDPNYIPALMVNSVFQQQKGDFNAAKATLEQVRSLNPLFTPASRDLAILCFAHFPDDPRIYDLATTAHQAFPDDADIAKILGVVAYQRGNYSAAGEYLRQSLRTRTNDGGLLYYLGMTQFRLKSTGASKQSLNRALALDLPAAEASEARRVLAELK